MWSLSRVQGSLWSRHGELTSPGSGGTDPGLSHPGASPGPGPESESMLSHLKVKNLKVLELSESPVHWTELKTGSVVSVPESSSRTRFRIVTAGPRGPTGPRSGPVWVPAGVCPGAASFSTVCPQLCWQCYQGNAASGQRHGHRPGPGETETTDWSVYEIL